MADPGRPPLGLPKQAGCRQFRGWRLVWAGAVVLAIAGSGAGLPPVTSVLAGDTGPYVTESLGGIVAEAGFWLLLPLLLPFVGRAVDRWGPRRMVLWGLVGVGAGLALYAFAQTRALSYASLFVMAVSGAVGGLLPVMATLNNWFRRRRAMAMSLSLIPSLLVILLTSTLQLGPGVLLSQLAASWELVALLAPAALVVGLARPISLMMRHRPEDYAQIPDGFGFSSGDLADEETQLDYPWREAVRSRQFWLITGGVALSHIASASVWAFAPIIINERGFSLSTYAGATFAMTLMGMLCLPVAGLAGDRMPIRWAIAAFAFLISIAICALAFADTLLLIYLFGALLGIGTGASRALGIVIYGAHFGRRDFATITGCAMAVTSLLSVAGVPLLAYVYDVAGFALFFLGAAGAVGAIGSVLFLFVGDPQLSPSQLATTVDG